MSLGRAGRLARVARKPVVFLLALAPAAYLVWALFADELGADPVEKLQQETGSWALIFLALTLAITPLRRLLGWNWLAPYRRMLGLFAFFYATLHLANYVGLAMEFTVSDIVEDVVEHPWVTIGMLSWMLLVPLAITSTKGWMRRLGGRRWQRLHRLVYLVAIGGVLHFFLAVKQDVTRPVLYGLLFATLLGARIWLGARKRAREGARAPGPFSERPAVNSARGRG